MASSNIANGNGASRRGEQEPLLGSPGDATQKEGTSLASNLWIGTGVLAQAGIWILTGVVWGAVFTHDVIFFSGHPLFNSAGILLIVQAILLVQPTHTPQQKRNGALGHSSLNSLGVLSLLTGFGIIFKNKAAHNGAHFESPHAILGLITYIFLVLQGLVGTTMYFTPAVYGGDARAKSIWKYHRGTGYITLLLLLATVLAATQTTYNLYVLNIRVWAVAVAGILILAGVVPRVKKYKFGL